MVELGNTREVKWIVRQKSGGECQQGIQLRRIGKSAAQADIPLARGESPSVFRPSEENDGGGGVAAGVGVGVGAGDQAIQHHSSHIWQRDGEDEKLVGPGERELEGPLGGGAVIDLAMPKGDESLSDDPA
jgi:hypothetical protein